MLYLLLLLSLILCCVAAAQNAAPAPGNPPSVVSAPVPPPLPPNPVETFRKVLAMSPPEREKFLSALSPEKRQIVMLKLDEYEGMPAEDRENRLRALQVRVVVRHLIKLPPSNRVERLAAMQPLVRQAVEARLAEWDSLPVDLQDQVLTNELAIRHIARSPGFMFNPALPPFPADPKMASVVKNWNDLSKSRRTEILYHFEYFVEEVSPTERAQIMSERQDLAKGVAPIADLSKEQRERYIAGLRRFAALTPIERQRFLMNAAQWQKMTPQQRESWRVLAKKLNSSSPSSPPPPPGRPSAAILPISDRAALDLPSR